MSASRNVGAIPEQVTRTMIFVIETARAILMNKVLHGIDYGGYPNCHGVARGYALSLRHLEVLDGAVVVMDQRGVTPLFHSVLQFRQHPEFGVDVSPLGAVPYLTFPNLIFFDEHVLFHACALPEEVLASADEAGASFYKFIDPIIRSMTHRDDLEEARAQEKAA